jgi:peptidyl-prolyl cis-trans isomerase C
MKAISLKINGEQITWKALQDEMARLKVEIAQEQGSEEILKSEDKLLELARDNMTEHVLFRQHAAEPLPSDKRNDPKAVAAAEETLRQSLVKTVRTPKAEDIESFYNEHKQMMMTGEAVHAAHIIKHVKDEAGKIAAFMEISRIKEQLDKGASFFETAMQASDCPSNGGDLGTFTRGKMVPEFEDVVFVMNSGETSGIFLTPFGYHIAHVIERIPSRTMTLQEATPSIKGFLSNLNHLAVWEEFTDRLRKKAVIEELPPEPVA